MIAKITVLYIVTYTQCRTVISFALRTQRGRIQSTGKLRVIYYIEKGNHS